MKASAILFFCLGQTALSWDLSKRQNDDVCGQGDLCASEVEGAANGSVYESMAEADCVSFMMHTATVAPVTVTSYAETTVTSAPNLTATLAARGVAGAAAEAAAYAVSFSKTVPWYAWGCNIDRYAEVCSCFGYPPMTVTRSAETATTVLTMTVFASATAIPTSSNSSISYSFPNISLGSSIFSGYLPPTAHSPSGSGNLPAASLPSGSGYPSYPSASQSIRWHNSTSKPCRMSSGTGVHHSTGTGLAGTASSVTYAGPTLSIVPPFFNGTTSAVAGNTTVLTLPTETTVNIAISTIVNANTTILTLPTASTVGTAISTFLNANTTVLVVPAETTININSTITATFTTNITTTIVTPVATSSPLPPVNCTAPTPNFCPGAPCVDFFNDASNCGACGHVCASGICQNGVCGTNACDGSVCGYFTSCGLSGSCICTTQESGQGFCLDGNTPCSALADCDSNADCGGGQICAVSTCCDRNVCIGAGICDNGLRPRSIFRPRGSTGTLEKTVGGDFWSYLDVGGKSE